LHQTLLTLEQVRGMEEQSNEQVLSLFLANTNCIEYLRSFAELSHIFSSMFQQTWHPNITQLYTLSPYSLEKE
jgi:high-affinity Fe2+/Pb2+ permease